MIRRCIAAVLALALGMAAIPSAEAQRSPRPGFQGSTGAPGRAGVGHQFNPKEITIAKPVPWQKQQSSRPGTGILKSTDGGYTGAKKSGPKSITTCVTPDGRRVRC
jgi:putative hemolysin